MGDAYQAPAFCHLHAAQAAGSSALTFQESVSGSTPKTAAMDRMGQLPVTWSAAGDKEIRLDRGAVPAEPVNRFVLLPGHALAGRRIIFEGDNSATPWTGGEVQLYPYTVARGATQYASNFAGAGIRSGLNVWDFPDLGYRYLRTRLVDGHPSNVPSITEWWWTRRHVPTVGPRAYEASDFFRGTVLRLPSGVRVSQAYGPTGREWTVQVAPVDGADYRTFEQLIAACGVSRDPILFDPPQPYEVSLNELTSTSGLTAVDVTLSTAAGRKVFGANSLQLVTGSGLNANLIIPVPAAYRDLRRCQVGLFVQCDTIGYLTSTAGVRIRLSDSTLTKFAEWDFGTNTIKSADVWYQLWVDLDSTPTRVGQPLDPSDVAYAHFIIPDTGGLNALFIQHLSFAYKDRAPALVEIDGDVSRDQVSSVPAGWRGQAYNPKLTLREVAA